MKIGLDFDQTFTEAPELWLRFAHDAIASGHDVRIVTARCGERDNIDHMVGGLPIIYCNGVAKRFYCREFAGWEPSIWVDDKPENVGNNSTATPEWLENWRATREY